MEREEEGRGGEKKKRVETRLRLRQNKFAAKQYFVLCLSEPPYLAQSVLRIGYSPENRGIA